MHELIPHELRAPLPASLQRFQDEPQERFFGDYHYGFETLDAEQRLQGPLFFADGTEAGAFNLRFQGGSVEGSATLYGSPFAYSGAKAF